jgi:hypothetical protein
MASHLKTSFFLILVVTTAEFARLCGGMDFWYVCNEKLQKCTI